jgi:hypothetical protein
MGRFMQCFSHEELEQLDEAQLEFLRNAIERELDSNPEVQRILRERFQSMYDRMRGQRRPRRPRGSRSAPASEPGSSE